MLPARASHLIWAFVLLAVVAIAVPASAQQAPQPAAPQQQAPVIDPDASVENEEALFRQAARIEGQIAIPNKTAAVLEQPAGRLWRYFHEVLLHWTAAIVILGMIALLGIAYLIIG